MAGDKQPATGEHVPEARSDDQHPEANGTTADQGGMMVWFDAGVSPQRLPTMHGESVIRQAPPSATN